MKFNFVNYHLGLLKLTNRPFIEGIVLRFWLKIVPRSWMYWAVMAAFAQATSEKYTDKHPDEVTWTMLCKFYKKK